MLRFQFIKQQPRAFSLNISPQYECRLNVSTIVNTNIKRDAVIHTLAFRFHSLNLLISLIVTVERVTFVYSTLLKAKTVSLIH